MPGVMCAAPRTDHGKASAGQVDVERVKSAMQWDLWNPWAAWYELNSTHPRVAKRLLRLSDQASAQGDEPYIVFDRAKPKIAVIYILSGDRKAFAMIRAESRPHWTKEWVQEPQRGTTSLVYCTTVEHATFYSIDEKYKATRVPQEAP